MSIAAGLRALADAIEAGQVEKPTLLVIGRIYGEGSDRGSATDYLHEGEDPPAWSAPRTPAPLFYDDGD